MMSAMTAATVKERSLMLRELLRLLASRPTSGVPSTGFSAGFCFAVTVVDIDKTSVDIEQKEKILNKATPSQVF
jgi:hypothetical protein